MHHEVKYYSKIILQGWAQNSVSSELWGSFCSPFNAALGSFGF